MATNRGKGSRVPTLHLGRFINPERINVSGSRIPDHTTNPVVQRNLRIPVVLSTTVTSYAIGTTLLFQQDAVDYLGASTNFRFSAVRINTIKCWLITPGANTTQDVYQVGITLDPSSTTGNNAPYYAASSYPVPGQAVSAIGVRVGALQRESWYQTATDVVLATITTSPVITGEGVVLRLIIDVLCDFN